MTPRKTPKILHILNGLSEKDIAYLEIKDLPLLYEAHCHYLTGEFFLMSKDIKKYEEFRFFQDLFLYLKHHYRSDEYKQGVYRDIRYRYFKEQELLETYINR